MLRLLVSILPLAALLALVAPSCGDDVTVCVPGKACTCTNADGCDDSCDGAGCAYTCTNTDGCRFSCDEGDCTVSATNAGAVSLDCPGGGCELTCTNVDSCSITSCTDCVCTNNTGFGATCE